MKKMLIILSSNKMGYLIIFIIFLLFLSCRVISSPEGFSFRIRLEFDFPIPTAKSVEGYDIIEIEGLDSYGKPGEPVIPFKTIKVLLPYDERLENIEIIPKDKTFLEGKYYLKPGQTLYPTSYNATIEFTPPNNTIYDSVNPFPSKFYSKAPIQELRGYKILILNLYPVQYIPKTGQVYYFKSMEVKVLTKSVTKPLTKKAIQKINFRGLPKDEERVRSVVDNPEMIESYNELNAQITKLNKYYSSVILPLSGVNSSESYEYVIITNSTLNSSFQKLIDWKKTRPVNPINTTIVLVENITDDPDYWCDGSWGDGCGSGAQFNDTQAMIRNFIKDAYNNWGIEYVLLGGDVEIIPHRGVYVYSGSYTDYDIPCDMYYGTLNGSWDSDNDNIFGEASPEEADFFAEVYIGRATVASTSEAE
ncbi:MAG: hypothetical protein KAT37_04145, partial [Candidatus Aenigmarchaeota archaeon]|nr:hypothetical protein [Candidatus Aenigmarchaeota archaeon]